jgi:hypothetical protein
VSFGGEPARLLLEANAPSALLAMLDKTKSPAPVGSLAKMLPADHIISQAARMFTCWPTLHHVCAGMQMPGATDIITLVQL